MTSGLPIPVEKDGIVIAYTSIYGHTAKAVSLLDEKLRVKGCPGIHMYDLARCDMSEAVADAFSCGKLVLATTTLQRRHISSHEKFH